MEEICSVMTHLMMITSYNSTHKGVGVSSRCPSELQAYEPSLIKRIHSRSVRSHQSGDSLNVIEDLLRSSCSVSCVTLFAALCAVSYKRIRLPQQLILNPKSPQTDDVTVNTCVPNWECIFDLDIFTSHGSLNIQHV